MGGRGSASAAASLEKTTRKRSMSDSRSGGGPGGSGNGKSAAEKLVGTSTKSVTKGMTQASLSKLPRSKLETIGILQAAKIYMKTFKIGADEAVRRAKLLTPQQTTAQLRKFVWKYRNID